jgi:hypothetical protein
VDDGLALEGDQSGDDCERPQIFQIMREIKEKTRMPFHTDKNGRG